MELPDTLNDDLRHILGRMCFECISAAQLMRANGIEIKFRAEDEQAAVLFWLLGLYAAHGAGWREAASAQMDTWYAAIKQQKVAP